MGHVHAWNSCPTFIWFALCIPFFHVYTTISSPTSCFSFSQSTSISSRAWPRTRYWQIGAKAYSSYGGMCILSTHSLKKSIIYKILIYNVCMYATLDTILDGIWTQQYSWHYCCFKSTLFLTPEITTLFLTLKSQCCLLFNLLKLRCCFLSQESELELPPCTYIHVYILESLITFMLQCTCIECLLQHLTLSFLTLPLHCWWRPPVSTVISQLSCRCLY